MICSDSLFSDFLKLVYFEHIAGGITSDLLWLALFKQKFCCSYALWPVEGSEHTILNLL